MEDIASLYSEGGEDQVLERPHCIPSPKEIPREPPPLKKLTLEEEEELSWMVKRRYHRHCLFKKSSNDK